MRLFVLGAAIAPVLLFGAETKPAATGAKTPGVRIPASKLKPEAVYKVPGAPDWMAIDEWAWVSNAPKNSVSRLDPKSDRVETIGVGKNPCSGVAVGFGSVWVPNCGDGTVSRIDVRSAKVTSTFPCTVADSEGGIAASPDSLWVLTDKKGVLSRIDSDTEKPVAEIRVSAGSYVVAYGEEAIWVTSTEKNTVTRIDPKTNLVKEVIAVGKGPRFLAVGEGAVWTLNQVDGTITRIDPKTDKVVATIEAGLAGEGGEIAAGEGSVWATLFGYPLTRIDPLTNKVAQQFVGNGGDSVRVGGGFVWLADLKGGEVWRLDPKRIVAIVGEIEAAERKRK